MSHLKILCAKRVTGSKFQTNSLKLTGTTVKNLVAWVTWTPGFVPPLQKIMYLLSWLPLPSLLLFLFHRSHNKYRKYSRSHCSTSPFSILYSKIWSGSLQRLSATGNATLGSGCHCSGTWWLHYWWAEHLCNSYLNIHRNLARPSIKTVGDRPNDKGLPSAARISFFTITSRLTLNLTYAPV
jgi:hypothetical protein